MLDVIIINAFSEEIETKIITNNNNGATIIHTYGQTGKLLKEEIILYSGRYKTTYFDENENPQYGIIKTATGSFGIIYYDQEKSPLFKYWEYNENDRIIQFYSTELIPIGKIIIKMKNGERKIYWEDEKKINYIIIILNIILLAVYTVLILRYKINNNEMKVNKMK